MLYKTDVFKQSNFWPELRESTDDYRRWDLSVKQKLPVKGLELFFNGSNLTGATDVNRFRGSTNVNVNKPALTLEQYYGKTLHKLVAFTQHAGLARNVKDHRLTSREMYLNPVLSFLYWKMEYHLTHHMFPTVPSYNLNRLHHHIKDQLPRTNEGLIDAYKEIIPAIMKQSKEEDYFLKKDIPQLQNV